MPVFSWQVPFSGTVQLFDRFHIVFFESDGAIIRDIDVTSSVGRFTPTANTATYPLSADEWSAIKSGRSEVFGQSLLQNTSRARKCSRASSPDGTGAMISAGSRFRNSVPRVARGVFFLCIGRQEVWIANA